MPALPILREFVRRNGRWLGAAVSVLALAAFVRALDNVLTVHDAAAMVRQHWRALLLALTLYGVAYVPMCVAWPILARGVGARIPPLALSQILLVSQIGKYLPGNVGHLLGRAYLARNRGVPLDVSGLAMSLEMIGVLAAGALFAAVAEVLSPGGAHSIVPAAAAALALALLSAVLFVSRKRRSGFRALMAPMASAVACYLVLFALLSAAYVALLQASSGPLVLQVAAAVVLSWLVGFMVPGAPAGLGLREMSFYALLAGSFPGPAVLFAAAGMRLVTLAGDGIAWLVGLALGHFAREATPAAVAG